MKIIYYLIITVFLLLGTVVNAQEIPDSGDILKETKPPEIEQQKKKLPQITHEDYKPPMATDSEISIKVKGFVISGNTVYSDEKLVSLLKDFKGKRLGLDGLYKAARVITKFYRDTGYFVARAYIPSQKIDEDEIVVEITVIEGRYDKFEMKNKSYVDTEIVQGFMDKLTNKTIVSSQSLERQMLLINDLGGAQVTDARIYPGDKVGTSNFTIGVDKERKYTGYAAADNYGSRYTGVHRLKAGGFVNSLSGRGDTFGISGLLSQNRNLQNARLNYETHLGYSGLKTNFSAAYTDYEIGKELEYLKAEGDIQEYKAGLSYSLIKTQAHTLVFSSSYNHTSIHNENLFQDIDKSVNSIKFKMKDRLNTSFLQKGGMLNSSLSVTSGRLSLDSPDARDAYSPKEGSFTKLQARLKHIQFLSSDISLQSKLKLQTGLNNKNLDSTESFSPGGERGVRGYKNGEVSGDKGYLMSLQLDYNLLVYKSVEQRISSFIDHAKVWYDQNPDAGVSDNDRILYAGGVQYSANYKKLSLKATLARGFGPDRQPVADGGNADQNLLFIQGLWRF